MFEITEAKDKKQLREFVRFPHAVYRGNKYWIPPLIDDEIKQLTPDGNPFFQNLEAKFWLCYKNGKPSGRIGALIDHNYNERNNIQYGRIMRMEFFDDPEVSKALFETAENWMREQGMKFVHGPLGLSNLDNQGLLIEGFEEIPSVASVYHLPYYQEHFNKNGYKKENDWLEFRLSLGEKAVNKAKRGAEIVKKRYGFEVIRFSSNKELQEYLFPVFRLLNEAFKELPYIVHFNDDMIRKIGEKYFKVLNPRYVRMIKKDGKLAAFIIGIPSLSEAMKKANGRLFPYGFFYVLRAMRHPKIIDLYLTGVAPEHQSAGAAVVLFAEIQEEMLKQGITEMETTGVFETNHNVISNWKNYDHVQHKRRRCYVKKL
jgi:hypothetical protein